MESSGPDRSRGPEGLRGLTSPRLRGVIILVALVPLVSSLWDKLSVLRMGRLGRRSDDQAPHEAALGEQSRWAIGTPRSGILVAVVIVAATTSVVLVAGVS